MKLWEDHQEKEGQSPTTQFHNTITLSTTTPPQTVVLSSPPTGKPVSHKFAKELLAGFVGGEVDKLAETKGMDEYDSIEARRHAKQSAENMYDQHYGQQGDEYRPDMDRPQYNRY